MRQSTAQRTNKEFTTVSIRNDNNSGAIIDGQPVFFESHDSADYPGVDVVDYTEGSAPANTFLGVAKTDKSAGLAVGDFGEAIVYGFTDVIVTRQARAASTDAWSSMAILSFGEMLIPESVGNYFKANGAAAAANVNVPAATVASDATVAAGGFGAVPAFNRVVLGQSVNSLGTQGSAVQSGALVYTARMKAFVRIMG